jgi:hypothetical protein
MADDAQKNEFFNRLKEAESRADTCKEKLAFLNKVISGTEPVSFSIIDRCREASLQLNQLHHVVTAHVSALAVMEPWATENEKLLKSLREEADHTYTTARDAMTAIVSWVPPAVNTRATGR